MFDNTGNLDYLKAKEMIEDYASPQLLLDDVNAFSFAMRSHRPESKTTYKEDEVNIRIVAPGSSKENFKVDIKDGILVVSHRVDKPDDLTRNFESKYELSNLSILEVDKITAHYKRGILEIIVPKVKPKSISVK